METEERTSARGEGSVRWSVGDVPAERLEAEIVTLADGTPLSDHAVVGLLPEAFTSLLPKDRDGQPIDASPRRRPPTRRQRRVLDERHPTCGHPGCRATAFLQHDHIHPDTNGGPTTLANLRRWCGPHNRARWQAREDDP